MNTMETNLAKQYQRKTDKQHILDNPDTYIGSIENIESEMWVYDDANERIVLRNMEYVPGLYKLFDEGIDYEYDGNKLSQTIPTQNRQATYFG